MKQQETIKKIKNKNNQEIENLVEWKLDSMEIREAYQIEIEVKWMSEIIGFWKWKKICLK